jgi:hypothetical protein
MRKLKYVKLFENFDKKSDQYHISDLVDEVANLPERSLKDGSALETLIGLLPKLSKSDAQEFLRNKILNSEDKGSTEYGEEGHKMVLRIPRPMGKDVDVPISKEMYFNLKRDYFDNKKIVAG